MFSTTSTPRGLDARRRAAGRDRRRASARRVTSTAPPSIRAAYTRLDARVRRLSARHPLRAQSQFHAGDRPAAEGARQQRRRQLDGRGRRRPALRLPARARSCSPASARAPTSSSRAIALGLKAINVESPGELDRLDRLAQEQQHRRARRAARQSRHRRAQPPAHLDRAQDQQVRRADRRRPGDLPRDSRGAPASSRSACTATSDRRSRRSIRCCARRAAAVDLARRAARRRRCRCGTSTSAAASASPTTARRRSIRPSTARALVEHRPAERA